MAADELKRRTFGRITHINARAGDLAASLGLPSSDKYRLIEKFGEAAPAGGAATMWERVGRLTREVLPKLSNRLDAIWPAVQGILGFDELAALGGPIEGRAEASPTLAFQAALTADDSTLLGVASLLAWAELRAIHSEIAEGDFLNEAEQRSIERALAVQMYRAFRGQ